MDGRFRRTFIATIVGLGLLVAVFAVVDRGQGPKLAAEQVDTTALVSQSGQTVRLFLNQRIDPVTRRQVTVEPRAAFTVASSGQLVAIQFVNPLLYGTTYHLSLAGVTSEDDSQSSSPSYSFRTASPELYYLHRSGGAGSDEIVETGIRGAAQSVVYSATRIQDFAVFERGIAVVTLDRDGHSSLVFVAAHGVVTPITLPGTGTVDLVHGDSDTGILGFTFTDSGPTTSRTYSSTLFTVDPNGTAIPKPVLGLDGKPLSVLAWDFVPSSNYLIVQAADQSVLLLDPTNPTGIVPLGSYLEVNSVATDGKSAVVTDENGPLALALPQGTTKRLRASRLDGSVTFGGAAEVVPGGWVQNDSTYDTKTGAFTQHLVFDDGRSARELFHTVNPRGSIDSFSVSPNNEFVAIETTPDVATSEPDGYLVNGRSTSVTTDFVDLATGALIRSVAGFDVSW